MSKSSLLNYQEFADDFGLAIRQKWHIWCNELNKELNGEQQVIGSNNV